MKTIKGYAVSRQDERDCEVFDNKEEALAYMQSLTGKAPEEWEEPYEYDYIEDSDDMIWIAETTIHLTK